MGDGQNSPERSATDAGQNSPERSATNAGRDFDKRSATDAGQYFESQPQVASRRSTVTLALADLTLTLATDRGVFAHGSIDAGTRLLLLDAPAPSPAGTFLDLGCGYGAIACALARRAPEATVWAVDVNERALALCVENAASNDVRNVRVATPNAVPADVRFDLVWSNPPIRIGKPALHTLLTTWLARLTPGGRAVLVVQRHLGADSLAAWVAAQGYTVERLAARQGYRLLDVVNSHSRHEDHRIGGQLPSER